MKSKTQLLEGMDGLTDVVEVALPGELARLTEKGMCRILESTTDESRFIVLERRTDGERLKEPVLAPLPPSPTRLTMAVVGYVVEGLLWEMPRLVPFTLTHTSLMRLAEYLYRYRSKSPRTLYTYIYSLHRFSSWAGLDPDRLVAGCLTPAGYVDPEKAQDAGRLLDAWVGELQARGLAPNTIANYEKPVKTLYRVHGVEVGLPFRYEKRVVYSDRAPTPEELQRLMDVADLRGRVIVSLLALGGFRIGTLCRLLVRHVTRDLDRGVVPLHVHVEATLTKGGYGDYDTFLAQEAVDYLRLYFDQRRRGTEKVPAEALEPNAPLIRSVHADVRTVGRSQMYDIVHNAYLKAGLIERGAGRRYAVRPHSLRKYFRTQLTALGVPNDYVEYMMGHKISTYNDVKMKGVDFLRNVYAASGLAIRPRTRLDRVQMLKEMVRAWGYDPEKILVKDALLEPHRTVLAVETREESEVKALSHALKEMLRKELLNPQHGGEPV